MTNVEFGGSFWLLTQVALLILYYGNVFPSLPWWVVWFPSLLVLITLGIFALVLIIIVIIGVFS